MMLKKNMIEILRLILEQCNEILNEVNCISYILFSHFNKIDAVFYRKDFFET